MLLSHSHRFIFVHIYKTGGTSVKKALQKYDHTYGFTKHLKSLIKKKPVIEHSIAHKHASALEISKKMDTKTFEDYHKFAVVRNPFDWQVSLYHYILRMNPNVAPDYRIIQNMKNFDEYVRWRVETDPVNQIKYVTNEKGEMIVDRIMKFENLDKEFTDLCSFLNIENNSIPHLNATRRRDHREYYNEDTIRLIENAFERDLNTFGYSF